MTAIPDYTEIYEGDRYCLMCRHACPVERVTKREATSPHGWALLVASVNRGQIAWDAETVDTLYQCADCGLCQANCVSLRPLPAAIVAARARVAEQGLAPLSARRLDESLRRWGHPYGDTLQVPYADAPGAAPETGLFVGAAVTARRPEAAIAAITILNDAGVNHALLSTARSGVYLPYTLGLWDTARLLAEQTIGEIRTLGIKQVITLSREDAHTFAHVYPEIGVAFPKDVRVIELIEWIDTALGSGSFNSYSNVDLRGYVYHDPAHTPRMHDSAVAARRVLRHIAGEGTGEMLWRRRAAAPAGTVGGLEWTQPALAEALTRERISQAKQAGAKGIVTEDPQCAAQLAKYAEGLPVVNLVELLAEMANGMGR